MSDKQNLTQIIRKDARGCFVESLWDAFSYGKAHLVFASYDMNRPAGQRQTNNIHIYLSMTELLELCRKAESGEMRYLLQAHKKMVLRSPSISVWAVHRQKNLPRLADRVRME